MSTNNHFQSCIELCQECSDVCQTTFFEHCLVMGGKHTEQQHVSIMMDCIQICSTAAGFMLRNSSFHEEICRICAEICEACGVSCEQIGGEEMLKCAEICYKCGEACHAMSNVLKSKPMMPVV